MFNLPVFMEYNQSIAKSMQIRMYDLSYPFLALCRFVVSNKLLSDDRTSVDSRKRI